MTGQLRARDSGRGGHGAVDSVSGYETTGHDWNGITELNTPFPRIVIWALVLAFGYALVAWVLLPSWPLGRDHTRGLLGLDQGDMAVEGLRAMDATRQAWLSRFNDRDLDALRSDSALMTQAMPAAARLFHDNCAACHGEKGEGGPDFPVLRDTYWLWGGTSREIAETIRVGINAEHPDTRWGQMPSFDFLSIGERRILAGYVVRLRAGTGPEPAEGVRLFQENCAACHSEDGGGGMKNGAPSLTDDAVIYGQDADTVITTLAQGRQGVMPSWSGRLTAAEINLLALYVRQLGDVGKGVPE